MTVHDAIHEVQKVGTIRAENGKLKLRFPEPERERLESVIETLRQTVKLHYKRSTGLNQIQPQSRQPQNGLNRFQNWRRKVCRAQAIQKPRGAKCG